MKQNLLLLISFQVIPVIITNKWSSQQDIILEHMENQAKIIRSGVYITKFINSLLQKDILIGSYSNKPIEKQISFYQSLGVNSKKIFFIKRNQGQPYIPANRALIENNNQIVYSYLQNVFSNIKVTERIAFITSLKVKQQNTIIIQNSKAQYKLLTHQKYKQIYLITQKNFLDILKQINKNIEQYSKQANQQLSQPQQFGERIQNSDLKLNKWQILRERIIFDIIPFQKSFKNKSISSFIIKKDNKCYLAKTEYSHQHQLQNELRQFASQFFQFFQTFVLPYTIGKAYIRNALINQINKKNTYYSISPYIRGLNLIQSNNEIFYKNNLNQKQLIGLGKIIFFAFLLNQDFRLKSLFQQMSTKNLYDENQILIYRFEFYSLFNTSQVNLSELVIHQNKKISIKISDCAQSIQSQFEFMIKKLQNIDQELLKNFINHHKWRFISSEIRQKLLKTRIDLLRMYSKQSFQNPQVFAKDSLAYILNIRQVKFPELDEIFKNLKKKYNFNLVGQVVNIYNLMNQIKSKGYFVQYLSLLSEKLQDYQLLKKKSSVLRQNTVLIVDYCQNYTSQQLETNINDFSIIFIYRIANEKLKSNKLPIIKVVSSEQYTQYQQITATIMWDIREEDNSYKKFQQFSKIWIEIKSFELKISTNDLESYLDDVIQYKNFNKKKIKKDDIYSNFKKYACFLTLEQYNFIPFIESFFWFRFLLKKVQLGEDFSYTVQIQKAFLDFQKSYPKIDQFKQLLFEQLDKTRISNFRTNIIKLLRHYGVKFDLKEVYFTEEEIIKQIFLSDKQIIVITLENIYIYSMNDLNRIALIKNKFTGISQFYQNQLFILNLTQIKKLNTQYVWEKISGEVVDSKFKMISTNEFFTYKQKEINIKNHKIQFEIDIINLQLSDNILFVQTGSNLVSFEIQNELNKKQIFKNIISFKVFNQKKLLVVTFQDFTLKIYNLKTLEQLHVIQQWNSIHCFCFGSNLDTMLTNLFEDVIYVWKISQNKIVKKIYEIGFIPKRMESIQNNKILLISPTGLSKIIYIDI